MNLKKGCCFAALFCFCAGKTSEAVGNIRQVHVSPDKDDKCL
jgi:hypothetical protein